MSLIGFDVFSCSYIAVLYLMTGLKVKNNDVLFVSMFNMIIMRAWISFSTSMIIFDRSSSYQTLIPQAIIEIIICYIAEDMCGYFIHRYMHRNKFLYIHVHQQHHRNQTDSFITAFDVHIVELVAFYFVGLLIGPTLISQFWRISFLGYNMWLCAATFFLIWSHTGLNVKWMPDTTFHNLHHKYYTVNYGTAFSDYLFGTAKWN